ncbi:MAG: ABC transporter permease [Planctomycetes bacterium]|nr:ABC transporter permease [Planctomycetota bacterium]
MRKMWVIANREYQAAVRTKAFIIGLLIMPILMGGSVVLQILFKDVVDTKDKKFVLVDRVGYSTIADVWKIGFDAHNAKETVNEEGKQIGPRFVLETLAPTDRDTQNFELSEKVRSGEIVGFVEILGPDAYSPRNDEEKRRPARPQIVIHYYTNRPTYQGFVKVADLIATDYLHAKLAKAHGLKAEEMRTLAQPVVTETKGLFKKDADGKIVEGSEGGQIASVMTPMTLMLLMFMIVLMSATPLMQGVVEEKMQRIAEVLLGSVQPFPLMLGKLVGMTGVSLTISAVYLGGAYWAANHYGFAENISLDLIVWFLVFQALAALMFGSLFIAIGAACTEMRETQNLMWPVMLLATFPMFLLTSVLREPNGPIVRGMSFFPFFTPSLMIARMATPPGLPWWEPALGIIGVLATTVFCVYAAGRIFRVGLLLQGKGAKLGEILRWVVKG